MGELRSPESEYKQKNDQSVQLYPNEFGTGPDGVLNTIETILQKYLISQTDDVKNHIRDIVYTILGIRDRANSSSQTSDEVENIASEIVRAIKKELRRRYPVISEKKLRDIRPLSGAGEALPHIPVEPDPETLHIRENDKKIAQLINKNIPNSTLRDAATMIFIHGMTIDEAQRRTHLTLNVIKNMVKKLEKIIQSESEVSLNFTPLRESIVFDPFSGEYAREVAESLDQQKNTALDALYTYLSTLHDTDELYPNNINENARKDREISIKKHFRIFRTIQSFLFLQNRVWELKRNNDIKIFKQSGDGMMMREISHMFHDTQSVKDLKETVASLRYMTLNLEKPLRKHITRNMADALRLVMNHSKTDVDLVGVKCVAKVHPSGETRLPRVEEHPYYDALGSQILRIMQCMEDICTVDDDIHTRYHTDISSQGKYLHDMRQNIRRWIYELKRYCDPDLWYLNMIDDAVSHWNAVDCDEAYQGRQNNLRTILEEILGTSTAMQSSPSINQYSQFINSFGR